jgi:hypothetical protein
LISKSFLQRLLPLEGKETDSCLTAEVQENRLRSVFSLDWIASDTKLSSLGFESNEILKANLSLENTPLLKYFRQKARES